MKISFRLLAALFVFSFIGFVHAGNWISQVLQVGDSLTIDVPGGHFLIIRNLTQEFSSTTSARWQVTAMDRKTGNKAIVLTATLADKDPFDFLEPVNELIIAGPSTVTIAGGDTTGFITYRKGEE